MTHPAPIRITLGCAILGLCAAIAGCASSKGSSGDAAATPAFQTTASGTIVPVSISDDCITLPASIPPGHTTFQIVNNTKHPRDLKIVGDGVDTSLLYNIGPGESGEMVATLHPGQYTVTVLDGKNDSPGISTQLTVMPWR